MAEELIAGIGQYVIGKDDKILAALALGSCVGVVLYDRFNKIAGLAHVMLPKKYDKESTREGLNQDKFADVAIPKMLEDMKKLGAVSVEAKIAGGAHMFIGISKDVMNVGEKNDEAVREILKQMGIKLISSDTGGGLGRTLKFDVVTAKLMVRTKESIKEI